MIYFIYLSNILSGCYRKPPAARPQADSKPTILRLSLGGSLSTTKRHTL